MNRIVVDCNILVKLFIPEVESDKCAAFFQERKSAGLETWIPELCIIEFANVIWHKVHRKELPLPMAREIIADFLSLPLKIAGHVDLVKAAFKLATELNITVYDASYAALAHYLRVPLITADKKLAMKLKDGPVSTELI